MNKRICLSFALIVLVCLSLPTLQARAQGRTITVPNDYSNIADAVTAAANGDTIFIRKGTYEGPINETLAISKTISLIGENKENTKLHLKPPLVEKNIFTYFFMGYADPITISADNVEITGLTVETLGGNILVNANKTTLFSNNLNLGVTVNGDQTQIFDNILHEGGLFIVGNNTTVARNIDIGRIEANGDYNLIAYNTVNGSTGQSIVNLMGNSSVVLSNTLVSTNNWSEVFNLGYKSTGNIIAKNNISGGGIEISPYTYYNTICGNNLNGWGMNLMGFNNLFYANKLSYVGIGGTHGGIVDAAYNTFYHNNFVDTSPEFQVYTRQPAPITWDNGYEGNYWSNYTGDGTVPYEVIAEYHYFDGAIRDDTNVRLGQDVHPLLSPFNIEDITVSLPDWAQNALQNTPQTLPFPLPTMSFTPSETFTPTVPSQQPLQSSPTQQITNQTPPPTIFYFAAAVFALIIVVGLFFNIKQHKKHQLGKPA